MKSTVILKHFDYKSKRQVWNKTQSNNQHSFSGYYDGLGLYTKPCEHHSHVQQVLLLPHSKAEAQRHYKHWPLSSSQASLIHQERIWHFPQKTGHGCKTEFLDLSLPARVFLYAIWLSSEIHGIYKSLPKKRLGLWTKT